MRKGLLAAIGAYVFWGLTAFYWRLLKDLPATELLVHRVLWALPLLLVWLGMARRLRELRQVTASDRWRLAFSALAVSVNWGLFVYAIVIDRVVEASLAYYINPFLSVAFGVILFGERLSRAQWIALATAFTGVAVMVVLEGRVPWISLTLAFSFATYGAMKKGTRSAKPLVALTHEVATVYALALAGAAWFGFGGSASFGGEATTTWLLVGAGAVTVLPLLLFGMAVERIPLAWVGLLQFITPTMLFLEGAFLFGEEVSAARWLGFSLVWVAVVLFLWDVRSRTDARRLIRS